jgi:hypothetical protein
VLSAFLGGYGKKGGGFLVHVLFATGGTFDLSFFVFFKGKNDFKRLVAVFAIEFIARHRTSKTTMRSTGLHLTVYARGVRVSRQVE